MDIVLVFLSLSLVNFSLATAIASGVTEGLKKKFKLKNRKVVIFLNVAVVTWIFIVFQVYYGISNDILAIVNTYLFMLLGNFGVYNVYKTIKELKNQQGGKE